MTATRPTPFSREAELRPGGHQGVKKHPSMRVFYVLFAYIETVSRKKKRKTTTGGEGLTHNPFDHMPALGKLPSGPNSESQPASSVNSQSQPAKTSKRGQKNTNRGRVDIIRQTAHRGGKAVTVVKNFTGIGQPEKQDLAKKMQKACGVGGTVKEGRIEIQGDKREEVKRILIEAGFKPVFAGG